MALLSSSFSYEFKYDVFLSFRGSDTRYGFTGNLWKALCERGIHTFIDDKELQRGGEITASLVEAIKESRIGIIVLSNNYASSSFCLDELVHIVEHIKEKDRLVLPVFYDVDPSHVRHQTSSYGEALAKHEATFKNNREKFKDNMEKLQKWKIALHKVANLSGVHFKLGNGYEHKFIGKIVKEVSNKINRAPLHVADYPVGMESQIQQVKMLLDVGSDDGVHMVGIHGIGGVGKTTLARAIYNLIADHFEGLCFLHNVRETSVKHGLVHLQEILLSKTVGLIDKLGDVNEGSPKIKQRLSIKKVLLILDDVDELKQLQALAGEPGWFSPGSKIIITTRDQHLLARHGVTRTYEVHGLHTKESLELFRWNAFKNKKVDPCYDYVVDRAITYASGLPLALEVIGSNLVGKSVEEWKSALDRYERIPDKEIQKILKVSFDTLEEEEQSVFLDIACCFKGYALAEVEYILHAHHGNYMKHHIRVLVEKSLIKINCDRKVTLHDLIDDMGKEIVRLESPKEPGKRSRLWFSKDIIQVLEDNTGSSEIEIIHLDSPFVEVEWDGEAFKKMKKLRTLIIRNGNFSEAPKYLPSSLRVLEWQRYPSKHLPSFHPKKLVVCKLPNNCFKSSELAILLKKKFVNLKVLNFDKCGYLTEIPDVSSLSNLEEFSFEYCQNLISIHDSIGFLNKLKVLSAYYCTNLKSFPPIRLTSLEQLNLSRCFKLENFPEILVKMVNITNLKLLFTAIKELPFSFLKLTHLQSFEVGHCGILRVPSSILMMPELADIAINEWGGCLLLKENEGEEKLNSVVFPSKEHLELSSCSLTDKYLPIVLTQYANVKELNLTGNNFTNVPECIKECHFLWKLILDKCKQLEEIRGVPPNLKHCSTLACNSLTSSCRNMLLNQLLLGVGTTFFCLPQARIPEWYEHRSRGPSISFWFRNKFPAITICLVTQGMPKKSFLGSVPKKSFLGYVRVILIIDGLIHASKRYRAIEDHAYFVDLLKEIFENNMAIGPLENNWELAQVRFEVVDGMSIIESGIHVFSEKCIMKDIRFTDPYGKRKLDEDFSSFMSQNHQLQKSHRSLDMHQQHMALLSLQQQMALLPRHRRKALTSGMLNLLLDRKEEYLHFSEPEVDESLDDEEMEWKYDECLDDEEMDWEVTTKVVPDFYMLRTRIRDGARI